jgi:hypothetical protein
MIDRRALYIDTELLLDEVRRTAPETETDSDVARTVATSLLICAAYAARGHVDAATMDRILGAEIDHQTREELAPEWARVRIHAPADR